MRIINLPTIMPRARLLTPFNTGVSSYPLLRRLGMVCVSWTRVLPCPVSFPTTRT